MAVAIQGAVLVREYQQAYTDNIVYRRRCDNCGYLAPTSAICVLSLAPIDLFFGCSPGA